MGDGVSRSVAHVAVIFQSPRRKTILWHKIDVYSAGGVNEIVIAVGYESCDHRGDRLTSR